MTVYEFFASLPAILAILGFVVFQFMKSHSKGDPATIKIVEKLRIDLPERFEEHSSLNSQQLHSLLSEDNSLRAKVSEQDFLLLQQTLKQQHISTLVVYSLCAILFIVGVGLFTYQITKPEPLVIDNVNISSANPDAQGLPVDLDNLIVQWSAAGTTEDITAYIESIETRDRSRELRVRSDTGSVEFMRDDYSNLLINRQFPGWNRVRAVFQSGDNYFYSSEYKLHVGLTILAINFGEKVKIGAMIDNSVVQRYNFEARIVAWNKSEPDTISLGGTITNGQQDYPIEYSEQYDWGNAKIAYLGPDDTRLIRKKVVSD